MLKYICYQHLIQTISCFDVVVQNEVSKQSSIHPRSQPDFFLMAYSAPLITFLHFPCRCSSPKLQKQVRPAVAVVLSMPCPSTTIRKKWHHQPPALSSIYSSVYNIPSSHNATLLSFQLLDPEFCLVQYSRVHDDDNESFAK